MVLGHITGQGLLTAIPEVDKGFPATSVLGNNFRTTNATGSVVQRPLIAADGIMCVTLKSKFVTIVGMDTAASRLMIVVRGTPTATHGRKYATTSFDNKDIIYI